ncbi:MAG: hypothetical protein R3305_03700, partial [Gammaproteobacteria bacterium]|nr:hypothetical protein [Gammaproteobacteria bacterium]
MAKDSESSSINLDNTDELPVLSEEAILNIESLGLADAGGEDELEQSVETLRAALESAEGRWLTLEQKLEAQNRAIAELQQSLGNAATSPTPAPAGPTAIETAATGAEPASTATSDPPEPIGAPDPDSALLERIATLEAYIAGRADRWRDMEFELETKQLRIAELEAELEQR